MLRVIHFLNIRAGADEQRTLRLLNDELADYARGYGCIERKTWKLLDANPTEHNQAVQVATYINEALWPSQQAADAFSQLDHPGFFDELMRGIEIALTMRYVDEGG
jgi:hypothetical protein